jgi:hypothetical protein
MNEQSVFLLAFFKFYGDPENGFKRIDLQGIFRTEKEAREQMSFCDEAGWYEGALIEERYFGHLNAPKNKYRIWLVQEKDGSMKEIKEPKWAKNIVNLIG